MAICHGNGEDHCCYVNGVPCPFLEENTVPGRRWSCGLFVEHSDWGAVHTDPRYVEQVKPAWVEANVEDCGYFEGSRDGRVKQCCFADSQVE